MPSQPQTGSASTTGSAEVTLHPRPSTTPASNNNKNNNSNNSNSNNPLPPLLHTPAGLALLELQGTINLPPDDDGDGVTAPSPVGIGRVDFPDYDPHGLTFDPASTAWMRRAYLYVGQHQRLTGEVRKLPRAVGVVRRRPRRGSGEGEGAGGDQGGEEVEELEVLEIVKYKIVFSSRPEPVGSG